MLQPCFILHKGGQAIKIIGPEALVAIEPGERVAHRLGGEPAGDDAAGLFPRDQPRIREDVEMLHHGG
jgi:hypothetical protein